MFFIFSGDNYLQKKDKIDSIKNTLFQKKPNADFLVIDNFDINEDITFLDSLIETRGLFEEKNIIMFINILENIKIKKYFLENLEKFQKSENAFILSEEKILKNDFEKIKKFAQISDLFEIKKETYNLFTLTNLIGRKDKKNLWIEYNNALENENIENIYNIFLWQIKTLLLVSEKKDLSSTNLKPFVYNKNKNFLKLWTQKDIEKKYLELINIQYKNRKFSSNFNILLENFILNL